MSSEGETQKEGIGNPDDLSGNRLSVVYSPFKSGAYSSHKENTVWKFPDISSSPGLPLFFIAMLEPRQ